MQEMWIRFLIWEDPLEEEMATHSSILDWEIPWTGEPGGLGSMGLQRVGHNLVTNNKSNKIVIVQPNTDKREKRKKHEESSFCFFKITFFIHIV